MKYAVTHCTFDREAGGNPLWHSCILLSKMNEAEQKLEVVDTWGFYGLPTTNRSDSYFNQLKKKLGLDVDLIGNHGWLRHEEVRFLDLGCGLHGTTFEVTEDEFNQLQQECLKMAAEQQQAVDEVVKTQGIEGKPEGKERIYSHEQYSNLIFQFEKIKAEQQKRPARLKPFELRLNFGWTGPSLACSSTCKSQSINLLSKVLSEEQIDRLTEGGKHPTVPRYSGASESIYLHSTGPLREHKKSSGDKVYYRDFKDADVKLYWTVPPQQIEVLSEETMKLWDVDSDHCAEIKGLVRKLQRLEWHIRNAQLPEEYASYQGALIDLISRTYKAFSIIEPKKDDSKLSGWQGFALSLFSIPRSEEEKKLLQNIGNAKMLLNTLYMAIVDNWSIDDELSLETEIEDNGRVVDSNAVESIVSYLSTEDKIKLCKIIGRNFVEEEREEEVCTLSPVSASAGG